MAADLISQFAPEWDEGNEQPQPDLISQFAPEWEAQQPPAQPAGGDLLSTFAPEWEQPQPAIELPPFMQEADPMYGMSRATTAADGAQTATAAPPMQPLTAIGTSEHILPPWLSGIVGGIEGVGQAVSAYAPFSGVLGGAKQSPVQEAPDPNQGFGRATKFAEGAAGGLAQGLAEIIPAAKAASGANKLLSAAKLYAAGGAGELGRAATDRRVEAEREGKPDPGLPAALQDVLTDPSGLARVGLNSILTRYGVKVGQASSAAREAATKAGESAIKEGVKDIGRNLAFDIPGTAAQVGVTGYDQAKSTEQWLEQMKDPSMWAQAAGPMLAASIGGSLFPQGGKGGVDADAPLPDTNQKLTRKPQFLHELPEPPKPVELPQPETPVAPQRDPLWVAGMRERANEQLQRLQKRTVPTAEEQPAPVEPKLPGVPAGESDIPPVPVVKRRDPEQAEMRLDAPAERSEMQAKYTPEERVAIARQDEGQSVVPPGRLPAEWVDTNSIEADPGAMQFKQNSDEQGVVKPLEGEWDDTKAGVVLVWEGKDGRTVVANGHHRLAHAKSLGVGKILVQKLRESEGYSMLDARRMAAEANIADGKGTIYDHAEFFRLTPEYTPAEAQRRGVSEKRGYAIGRLAADNLYAKFRDRSLDPEKAAAIARAAPGDGRLQVAAIDFAETNPKKTPREVAQFVHGLRYIDSKAKVDTSGGDDFLGEMGLDDSARKLGARMQLAAEEMAADLRKKIAAAGGAAIRPESAAELGVFVENPDKTKSTLRDLRKREKALNNYSEHPELAEEIARRADLLPEDAAPTPPKQDPFERAQQKLDEYQPPPKKETPNEEVQRQEKGPVAPEPKPVVKEAPAVEPPAVERPIAKAKADQPELPELPPKPPEPPKIDTTEPEPGEPSSDVTSIKNEVTAREREKRDMPPAAEQAKRDFGKVWDEALDEVGDDPAAASKLVQRLKKNPTAVTDKEDALLLHHQIELQNRFDNAAEKLFEAQDKGADNVAELQSKADAVFSELLEAYDVVKAVGTETARGLNARKMLAKNDYTLATRMARRRIAKGEALTPKETADIKLLHDELQAKEKAIAEREKQVSSRERDIAMDEWLKDTVLEVAPKGKAAKAAPKRLVSEDAVKAARERIQKKLSGETLYSGLDPELLADTVTVGVYHIENGVRRFADWSQKIVSELGEAIRPHLESVWKQSWSKKLAAGDEAAGAVKGARKPAEPRGDADAADDAELSPEALRNKARKLARQFIKDGITERESLVDAVHEVLKSDMAELTRSDTMDAISGYGDYRQLSKDEVSVKLRGISGELQQLRKLEDMAQGLAPKKTGVERRTPTDEERRLTKLVNEAKKKGGYTVTDPATQLRSALDATETRLKNQIADLEQEIATRQRIVKERSPAKENDAIRALKAKRDELKKRHSEIFGKPGLSDAQKLAMAENAAKRSHELWIAKLVDARKGVFDKITGAPKRKSSNAEIERIRSERDAAQAEWKLLEQINRYQKELDAGKVLAKPKAEAKPGVETDSIRAAREQRDKIKKLRDEALQVQIWNKARQAQLRRESAKYAQRLAEGDFGKKPKVERQPDQDTLALKAERDLIKQKFEKADREAEWERMSVFQKTGSLANAAYDSSRSIMAGMEMSYIGRQGKLAFFVNPKGTIKALGPMLKALRSEKAAKMADIEIQEHPDYPRAVRDGVAILWEDARPSMQEEIFSGRFISKIPGLQAFNRSARVFLNKVRFDTWRSMTRALTDSTYDVQTSKQVAKFVNQMTGRGQVWGPAEPVLRKTLFSSKFVASRLQLATGQSMWGGNMQSRKLIAGAYAKILIGRFAYTSMVAMGLSALSGEEVEIENDPRSSDFMKLKMGETRVDLAAGLGQSITLISRLATGEKKTLEGRIVPTRGPSAPYGGRGWDVATRFARTKLHPVPAYVATLFDGTGLDGKPVSIAGETRKFFTPITYEDIYSALKEHDLPTGTALSMLAFLGESVQTYQKKQGH